MTLRKDLKNNIQIIMLKFILGQDHFYNAKSRDSIEIECSCCQKPFYRTKKSIANGLRKNSTGFFCSKKCRIKKQITSILIECKHCNKKFHRIPSILKHKKNNFCSQSCAAVYNNKHKTTGFRRSKLELYLETKLSELYPNLEIKFNDRTTIGAELDIYIPFFKLAFELNGILHYEPIYSLEKLNDIQKRDKQKLITCFKHDIELCILDVSKYKYFKENTASQFLNIIKNVIQNRIDQKTHIINDYQI